MAIDKASLDLIDKAPVIPGSTSARPPDLLGRMHHTSSLIQLETAEKLKMGTLTYELVSVQPDDLVMALFYSQTGCPKSRILRRDRSHDAAMRKRY